MEERVVLRYWRGKDWWDMVSLLAFFRQIATKMTGGADTSSKKPKMSDSERSALMAKMDADLENHFAELERKAAEKAPRGKDPDGWTEENWEEEMQKHPFFNQVMSYLYFLFKL